MDQVTQQNAALVEEMAAAASSLNSQAHELVNTVAFFKLSASEEHAARAAIANSAGASLGRVAGPKAFLSPAPRSIERDATASIGINLDTAIQAHANWRSKLRTALTQKEQLDEATVSRDDCCDLGKWLHGAGGSQYGGKLSFVNLVDSHRQFHQEAGKVARLINQGAYDEAQKQLENNTAFSNASQKVGAAVIQLAKELKVKMAGAAAAKAPPLAPAKQVAHSHQAPRTSSAADDGDWESF
jgi:NADPH:quinone reductase-like Zn-dependent oxidoreductase